MAEARGREGGREKLYVLMHLRTLQMGPSDRSIVPGPRLEAGGTRMRPLERCFKSSNFEGPARPLVRTLISSTKLNFYLYFNERQIIAPLSHVQVLAIKPRISGLRFLCTLPRTPLKNKNKQKNTRNFPVQNLNKPGKIG